MWGRVRAALERYFMLESDNIPYLVKPKKHFKMSKDANMRPEAIEQLEDGKRSKALIWETRARTDHKSIRK